MTPHTRRTRIGFTALTTFALMMTVLVTPATAETEIKTFTAAAVPGDVVAGATVTFTVEITNDPGTPHELGSANVTVPDAFGGGVVELRDLALEPGASTSIEVTRSIPCVEPGAFAWGVELKQSNDFNGTGNGFVGTTPVTTITAGCFIAFVTTPADGARNEPLAATDFGAADTDPIVVGVFDGSGAPTDAWTAPVALDLVANPGGATLAQGVTIPSGGLAVFGSATAPVLDRSASGYTMRAISSDGGTTLTTGASGPFTIVDAYEPCTGSGCTASSAASNGLGLTDATVSSTSTTGAIIMSVGSATSSLDCAGYDETSSILEFDVIDGDDVGKTVVLTWYPWDQPARKYRVCWGAPVPFMTRDGDMATDSDGDGLFEGLLPDCRKNDPVAPCVSDYSQSPKDGSVTVTVLAPVGDPVMRI